MHNRSSDATCLHVTTMQASQSCRAHPSASSLCSRCHYNKEDATENEDLAQFLQLTGWAVPDALWWQKSSCGHSHFTEVGPSGLHRPAKRACREDPPGEGNLIIWFFMLVLGAPFLFTHIGLQWTWQQQTTLCPFKRADSMPTISCPTFPTSCAPAVLCICWQHWSQFCDQEYQSQCQVYWATIGGLLRW